MANFPKKSGDMGPEIFSQLEDGSEEVFIESNQLTEARLQTVIISILVNLTATDMMYFGLQLA